MVVRLASRSELDVRTPGGIPQGSEPLADATLDDASALVAFEAQRELDEADYATLTDRQKAMLRSIVCSMARRSLANPDGLQEEHLGPYGATASNASPDIYMTANELRQVRRLRRTGGLATIGLTRGPIETHRCWDDGYAPTVGPDGTAGEPISFTEPDTL